MKSMAWMTLGALVLTGCPGSDGMTDTMTDVTDTTGVTDTTTGDTGTTEPDTTAPTIVITAPLDKSQHYYKGFDDTLKLWYAELTLEGTATDPEDGALTGKSLVWTTDQTTLQDATLGTGAPLTVRLYSDDCFGVTHTITLTATDAAGNSASESVEVFIFTLC